MPYQRGSTRRRSTPQAMKPQTPKKTASALPFVLLTCRPGAGRDPLVSGSVARWVDPGFRRDDSFNGLERPVALDLGAMHDAPGRRIEGVAPVHHAAIVPQDQIADPPLL